MTNESGEFTPEQLAKMDSLDVVALLRRNSGDPNFFWRVREAVLNRAADEIKRLLKSEAEAERIALHWQTEAQKSPAEPTGDAIQQVILAEREACAQVCEARIDESDASSWGRAHTYACQKDAASIRSRTAARTGAVHE